MSRHNIKIKAFSLIELSIVILIIGILISGILTSKSFLQNAKLQTARNLTISSPVNGIKNLVSWYETSLENSFQTTEAIDGSAISVWYNINPQSIIKNNITQTTEENKPKFYENVFNGIPSVRFDGVDDGTNGDYLSFDSSNLMSTNFTIFVVEKRGGDKSSYDMFLSGNGDTGIPGTNLALGYRNSDEGSTIVYAFSGDLEIGGYDESTVQQQPTIHTFWFSQTNGKQYWMNGGKTPDVSNSEQLTPLDTNPNSSIGGYKTHWPYIGDIAEFIVFNRDLKTEEREAVENYLSQKYKIAISG